MMDGSPKWFRFSNTQSLQVFHLLRQGAMIGTSVLLAKSRLTVADIGAYELLMYLAYTLSFWWVTGLAQGILTKYPRLAAIEQKQLIFNGYLLFLSISTLLFVLLWGFPNTALQWLTGQTEIRFFDILLIFALLNFPTFLLENYLLLQNKSQQIIIYGSIAAILQPIVVIIPVWLGLDFQWSIIGLVVLAAFKHSWLFVNVWQNGSWQLNIPLLKNIIYLSLPLVAYSLLGGFNVAFDNWLVNFHYNGDPVQFAIFRYGAQELPLTLALTNALGTALLPDIAKNLSESLSAIKTKSLRLFHLLFPLTIVIILTDRWLFPILFNPNFIASVPIFNVYLLILISRLVFARSVLVGLQANRQVLVISVIELIINALLSFWLVQYWGMVGIAVGTLIAYSVEKILLCAYLYVRFGVPMGAYTDIKWFVIYNTLLISAFFITFLY
ncbi:MAG: lipopolysaccharide biosynthesis protein [Saprospiraceae bacterium]